MTYHALSHWLGFAGEAVNFVGATVLALDLLLRRHEFHQIEDYKRLKELADQHGLRTAQYKKIPLSEPDFTSLLVARRATRLGLLGVCLLAVGFSLLGSYHMIQILHP
jgi:hypothetical protein